MFRTILFLSLIASATAAPSITPEPAADPIVDAAAPDFPKFSQELIDMMINRSAGNFLPTADDSNDLHACLCIMQGPHCKLFLAASSKTCTAHILRRHQTHPCILRCARFCFYDSPNLAICHELREWLDKKVYKIFRRFYSGDPADHEDV